MRGFGLPDVQIQPQAPPNVGPYTWRVFGVNDTYVWKDTCQDITVRIFLTFIRLD